MRKVIIAASIGSLALAACGSSGVLNRQRPDEFAVSRQAPLVVPPDFALTPPKPGAPRPQAVDSSRQALEALFGGPQARSATERQTLARAGKAAPGIRSSVGDPETKTVNKGSVTRDIIAAPEGNGQFAQAVIPAG